jgi:hypothetical protein
MRRSIAIGGFGGTAIEIHIAFILFLARMAFGGGREASPETGACRRAQG